MFLLADSGSTKTDWTLCDAGGPIETASTDGINPFFMESETIYSILNEQLTPQISKQPSSIFYYGTGCANEQSSGRVLDALRRIYPSARIEVHSDLLGAARSLCGGEPGIACILGTGSNNAVCDGHVITANIGSLGFWMGDEGSGGYLGKKLIQAFIHRELPSDLERKFQHAYPEVDRLYVLDKAYKQTSPNRFFAGFSTFYSSQINHPYITWSIHNAFEAFLEKYVVRHPQSVSSPVHFTGSIAWHFKAILMDAAKGKNLKVGRIEQKPMPGLIRYHQNLV